MAGTGSPVSARARSRRRAGFLLAVALCFPAPSLLAQQFGFTQFAPRNGLAQSQVRCMAQDRSGYLWFGTLGGASRFDGEDFINFGLRDGLPDPQVNALLGASDGTVWLGCGSFLVHFDGHAMHTVPLPKSASDARILALAEGTDGTIYIGSEGAGLLQLQRGLVSVPPHWPKDTASSVRTLLIMHDGSLLAGLRNGLLRGGSKGWTPVKLPISSSISALALGKDGTIWVGTYGDGLFGLQKDGTPVEYNEANGLLQNNVRALLVDRRDRLWAGTKFGVDLLEDGRLRAYTVHQGMPNDNVWCLFEDDGGGLWFGTDGAGVLRYAGESYVTYTVTEGLCSDLVMCALSDKHGDIWLGTYGNGVCRMDGMAQISTLDGLPNNTVWCGLVDRDSSLWFGTSDGLCHIVNGIVIPLEPFQALTGQRVLSLFRAPTGDLWCGTRDGVSMLHPDGSVEQHGEMHGTALRGVRSIRSTTSGTIWLATDLGAVRIEGDSARCFTTADGMSHNNVFCLSPDAKGRLWMGTSNGLTCYDKGHFTRIDLGMDFGSNYVDLLLRDESNNLWAGTNNGLFRFNPDSLLADPSAKEHVTEEEGLRGLECNLNAGYLDARGRLYFGTNAGLVVHDPVRKPLRASTAPPITHITAITSFLEPIAGSDSIGIGSGPKAPLQVGYRKNHLTFTYTAIALANGQHVRFQYRLIGFDNDRLPPTEARFASYSNLPQGAYTFEVRAADSQGRWGPAASVDFTITPPFWLRWWFFALCAAILAGILLGVMRYRKIRRQRAEKTHNLILRSRMLQFEQQALNANMNRHFIFNALNSIQYSINRQDRTMANKYLTSFAKLIRKNLDASQNDTTTLAEELSRLELYLVLEHMRFKDKFQYSVSIAPEVDTHAVKIPAMMLQPYVENSIWHGILPMARPGRVEITVDRTAEGRTRIRITDDGIGIDHSVGSKNGTERDHISRGIEITKGRADILRKLNLADIRIQGPEQLGGKHGSAGTQVVIELPSPEAAPTGPDRLRSGT
ncbi:MAG: histidine kinase [Flavobacteriales bacterium]|nr:histidine kinase [Flavobacteriales bacterium]MBK7246139.1 histidine kinase [Flavobacteriales bacterium]MBK9060093.1 histidine kinase [Flavobacteriales bacterium]MBK9599446.1 histidine kinase [Flavobacteriales bacterium]QQS71843.1 MAG: histidine kinase [Flavobacteriales bacterium]